MAKYIVSFGEGSMRCLEEGIVFFCVWVRCSVDVLGPFES